RFFVFNQTQRLIDERLRLVFRIQRRPPKPHHGSGQDDSHVPSPLAGLWSFRQLGFAPKRDTGIQIELFRVVASDRKSTDSSHRSRSIRLTCTSPPAARSWLARSVRLFG